MQACINLHTERTIKNMLILIFPHNLFSSNEAVILLKGLWNFPHTNVKIANRMEIRHVKPKVELLPCRNLPPHTSQVKVYIQTYTYIMTGLRAWSHDASKDESKTWVGWQCLMSMNGWRDGQLEKNKAYSIKKKIPRVMKSYKKLSSLGTFLVHLS